MEAARVPGEREADVAPATETASRASGWTPADPGPLGLAGFAMTTFVLSMYNADLINAGGTFVVLSLALAYGGIAQPYRNTAIALLMAPGAIRCGTITAFTRR